MTRLRVQYLQAGRMSKHEKYLNSFAIYVYRIALRRRAPIFQMKDVVERLFQELCVETNSVFSSLIVHKSLQVMHDSKSSYGGALENPRNSPVQSHGSKEPGKGMSRDS